MLLAPAATLLVPPNPVAMGIAVFFGWLVMGMSPLYIGVIPSDCAPPHQRTSAIGLTTAAGEIFGGVIAPSCAGWLADRFGLTAPFLLCILLALVSAAVTLFLEESAPRRTVSPSSRVSTVALMPDE
jgi:sugar phosphate permease